MSETISAFQELCRKALRSALEKEYPTKTELAERLEPPASFEFGELASSSAFQIARETGQKPVDVANKIRSSIQFDPSGLLERVEVAGGGYVNFRLNYAVATPQVIQRILREKQGYGFSKTTKPLRVVVEYVSANPNGPLHLGHVRNTILGNCLARLLRNRGHSVKTRFYIDDTGKQVAILAFGYEKLGRPKPKGKPDHWFGLLYACTNCAFEIETLRKKLEALPPEDPASMEERKKLNDDLARWLSVAQDLQASDQDLFNQVVDAVRKVPFPDLEVEKLVHDYESQTPDAVSLVRQVSESCLAGIRETLHSVGVDFDIWDWESDLVWSKEVDQVLQKLAGTRYVTEQQGALVLESKLIADAFTLREQLGLTTAYDIPPLTLTRSDGTTLYATRDIAYTLRKFRDADRVINVIGVEQKLPQLHIKLALVALGMLDVAQNLIHYAYGLVELEGMKMSRRRGRFISFDELIDQASSRTSQEVAKRQDQLRADEAAKIATAIAQGAIRYSMISISSNKAITFSWDRVLTLERNSAPFINYAYTRAVSILRKVGLTPAQADLTLLKEPIERWLVYHVANFPHVFVSAADNLGPEEAAAYANSLAEKFHEYYEKFAVLRAETEALRDARAQLVEAVAIVLQNCMGTLGIQLTERM